MNPPRLWKAFYGRDGWLGITFFVWASSWYHARAGAEVTLAQKFQVYDAPRERIEITPRDAEGLTPPKPVKLSVIRAE